MSGCATKTCIQDKQGFGACCVAQSDGQRLDSGGSHHRSIPRSIRCAGRRWQNERLVSMRTDRLGNSISGILSPPGRREAEGEVPSVARNDTCVHDCHADRRKAIRQERTQPDCNTPNNVEGALATASKPAGCLLHRRQRAF